MHYAAIKMQKIGINLIWWEQKSFFAIKANNDFVHPIFVLPSRMKYVLQWYFEVYNCWFHGINLNFIKMFNIICRNYAHFCYVKIFVSPKQTNTVIKKFPVVWWRLSSNVKKYMTIVPVKLFANDFIFKQTTYSDLNLYNGLNWIFKLVHTICIL